MIIETATHVFESVVVPDTPGRCDRTLTLTLLSGPPLTPEQAAAIRQAVVRGLIDGGNHVYRAGFGEVDQ